METYRFLLGLIARERMIRNRDYDALMPLVDRLDREIAWTPTLEEAASLCARSPSSLNRLCKKATGMAFKPFIIESKLARADRYLRQFPDKTIVEIAGELGYDDALYFSRFTTPPRGFTEKDENTRIDRGFQIVVCSIAIRSLHDIGHPRVCGVIAYNFN
jgi:AraC-like DNA-binding protein